MLHANESCHVWINATSHVKIDEGVDELAGNVSCEQVSRVQMGQVMCGQTSFHTYRLKRGCWRVGESCRIRKSHVTYKRVLSRTNESCRVQVGHVTCQYIFMEHHVTHTDYRGCWRVGVTVSTHSHTNSSVSTLCQHTVTPTRQQPLLFMYTGLF